MAIPRTIRRKDAYIPSYLDQKNFDVILIIKPKALHSVYLQKDNRHNAVKLYCVQYRGSGHYFDTKYEALAYCLKRGWTPEKYVYQEVTD